MKIERNHVLNFIYFLCFLFPNISWAVQKATIVGPEVEIYENSDFDSDIISRVHEGETYLISNKTYGAFYRIKLKDGKIGYIVDYELDIEGKGRFKEKDLDNLIYEEMTNAIGETEISDADEAEEAAVFGRSYSGPSLQLINYHEDTMGANQLDDLLVVGYKKVADVAWSVLGTYKVPKYYVDYADKTGGSVKGLKLWGDLGFSGNVIDFGHSGIRFSGALFTHVSLIQLETPARKYDLYDATAGLTLEVGWLIKIKKSAIDIAVKYYFDKTNYSGLGLSFLF